MALEKRPVSILQTTGATQVFLQVLTAMVEFLMVPATMINRLLWSSMFQDTTQGPAGNYHLPGMTPQEHRGADAQRQFRCYCKRPTTTDQSGGAGRHPGTRYCDITFLFLLNTVSYSPINATWTSKFKPPLAHHCGQCGRAMHWLSPW